MPMLIGRFVVWATLFFNPKTLDTELQLTTGLACRLSNGTKQPKPASGSSPPERLGHQRMAASPCLQRYTPQKPPNAAKFYDGAGNLPKKVWREPPTAE